jgi:hypothetical protein
MQRRNHEMISPFQIGRQLLICHSQMPVSWLSGLNTLLRKVIAALYIRLQRCLGFPDE